jgi:hypothetical protein
MLENKVADVLVETSQRLKWQEVGSLLRLEGFQEPWERVICEGRWVVGW